MGIAATDYLLEQMPDFVNVEFTAQMEDALDKVADGSLDWEREVADFYAKLTDWLAADPDRVSTILGQLGQIRDWRAPTLTKTGKVSWDDHAFYDEMRAAVANGEPLSKAQLATLTRMAIAYRDQLPGLEAAVGGLPPPIDKAEVEGLLAALEGRSLTAWEQKFADSVKAQFQRKGDLSPKQLLMLRRIAQPAAEAAADRPDNEAPARELLAALAAVKEWNEPVTRGKRTYDDRAFADSLARQLDDRHFLTERQFEALKRLVRGYQAQIPDYVALAAKHGIKPPAPRRRAAAKPAKKA